jgi:formate dehydrogenase iron-sulfur subunit
MAFERSRYGAGEHQSAGWPFHSEYEHRVPPDDGAESELTSGYRIEPGRHYGFFTDTTLCIGCKACEVACKQWNNLPADEMEFLATSHDNTRTLGHSTWRHVKFIEQPRRDGRSPRWLMQSDLCKHCQHAGCLEACPTGAIIRSEFGSVVIQQDICNGCKYCIPSCPYGVISLDMESDGKTHKCTLCYDRLKGGMEPACAKACPTDSIQYGQLDELRERAQRRLATLHERGVADANLYLADERDGVNGAGAFFLLLDEPEAYGLPPDPVSTTRDLGAFWKTAGVAAGALLAGVAAAFLGGGR